MGPPTSFNQVAALLSACKLLIGLDGGLNHLSVATDTPCIALFGKLSAKCWSPEGYFPHHYHLIQPHDHDDDTLGITPNAVIEKIHTLFHKL